MPKKAALFTRSVKARVIRRVFWGWKDTSWREYLESMPAIILYYGSLFAVRFFIVVELALRSVVNRPRKMIDWASDPGTRDALRVASSAVSKEEQAVFLTRTQGSARHWLFIDPYHNVSAAHILVEDRLREDGRAKTLRAVLPKKGGNPGFQVDLAPEEGLDAEVRRVSPALEEGGEQTGVRAEVGTNKPRVVIRGADLGDMRDIREHLGGRAGESGAEAPARGWRTEERPPILRRPDGSVEVAWEARTQERFTHVMRLSFPRGTAVSWTPEGDLEVRSADGPVAFSLTMTTDHPRRDVLTPEQIFRPEALAELRRRFGRGKDAERLKWLIHTAQLLIYPDAMYAGSWRFMTYFGRDTLLTMQLLRSALRPEILEGAVQSVLDRVSEAGRVAHEEDLRWAPSDPRRLDHKMADETPMLLAVLPDFLEELGPEAARDFLQKERDLVREEDGRPVRETNRETLARVAGLVLEEARRFDGTPQSLLAGGQVDFQWRDSRNGLGRGAFAYDVNAVWMPGALKGLEALAALEEGEEVLRPLLRRKGELSALRERWDRAGDLFQVHLDADALRDRLRRYYAWLEDRDPKLAAALRRERLDGVSVEDFLAGQAAPASLKDGVSYRALALDKQGRPIGVNHLDTAFRLFNEDRGSAGAPQTGVPPLRLRRPDLAGAGLRRGQPHVAGCGGILRPEL